MRQTEFYDYLGEARSSDLTESEHYRVHRSLALLPTDAKSVIDVASGDGRLARHLLDVKLTVQCDIAMSSLLAAEDNRVQTDVALLPFADRAFDAAICCEGLEHFPSEIYEAARREIPRVASRYILISVPYREDVVSNMTKCAACGTVFHKWGHLRRFTKKKIAQLFPGFGLRKFECFGKSSPFKFRLVQRVNQNVGGVYTQPSVLTICMHCGEKSYDPPRRSPVSLLMGAINRVTGGLIPTGNKNWAVAVFERR